MTTRSTGNTHREVLQQPGQHQSTGGVAPIEPELLAVKDAARFLSLSERSIDDLVAVGELHPIRVPGMRRKAFRTSDLRAAVRRWAVASGAAADDSETPSADRLGQ